MARERIHLFDVGPRDGLQNESQRVSTALKWKWIQELVAAGVRHLELGAFVRPDKVPQMKDSQTIAEKWSSAAAKGKSFRQTDAWFLVPNLQGLERAREAGVKNIAVFTAATDGFSKANTGMTVSESLKEMANVVKTARAARMRVRGYVSTVFGCPFEGRVDPLKALRVIEKVGEFGVEQVSIGDTIGVATPKGVEEIVRASLFLLGGSATAVHFHDTRGSALANTLRSIELGVRTIDASSGGLGGCPFAPGATGNLAMEDVVYLLHGMGFETGIDLEKLCAANLKFFQSLKKPLASRYLASVRAAGGHWPATARKRR